MTFCDDCRYGRTVKNVKTKKQLFDEFQTPFWKMAGFKPKPHEVKFEKWLKAKGMTYGDYRRLRDSKLAKQPSAVPQFYKHYQKYGRNNAPNPSFTKAG